MFNMKTFAILVVSLTMANGCVNRETPCAVSTNVAASVNGGETETDGGQEEPGRENQAAHDNLVLRVRAVKDCINPFSEHATFEIQIANSGSQGSDDPIEVDLSKVWYWFEPYRRQAVAMRGGGVIEFIDDIYCLPIAEPVGTGLIRLQPGERWARCFICEERRDGEIAMRVDYSPSGPDGPLLLEVEAAVTARANFSDLDYVLSVISHETDEDVLLAATEVLIEYHVEYVPRFVSVAALLDVYRRSQSPQLAKLSLAGLKRAAELFAGVSQKQLEVKDFDGATAIWGKRGILKRKVSSEPPEFALVRWAEDFLEYCPEVRDHYRQISEIPSASNQDAAVP